MEKRPLWQKPWYDERSNKNNLKRNINQVIDNKGLEQVVETVSSNNDYNGASNNNFFDYVSNVAHNILSAMPNPIKKAVATGGLALAIAACAGQAAPTISPSPTAAERSPTAQSSPTPTIALSPTPTLIPTEVPTQTLSLAPTPTYVPTAEPTPIHTPIPTPEPTQVPTPTQIPPTEAPTLIPTPAATIPQEWYNIGFDIVWPRWPDSLFSMQKKALKMTAWKALLNFHSIVMCS